MVGPRVWGASWIWGRGYQGRTYVRVPPDLLDGGIIEVTGVAQEVLANLVCVLQAVEDIVNHGLLATLAQLETLILSGGVNVLDPVVVVRGAGVRDVLLELDDV